MKNALKIAIVTGIAVAGIAACTSSPTPDAAPVTPLPSATIAPPTSVVTAIVTSTVTNQPEPNSVTQVVDNRIGYGALKLGMTADEAVAAGLTGLDWGQDTCTIAENVAISKKYGIERITLPAEAKTSKGIGVGSTVGEMKRAYPNAKEFRAGFSVELTDTAHYVFGTYGTNTDDTKIVEIKLGYSLVDCAMAYL
ncbi:hypothetical protein ACFWNN_24515 [Lentzea sp. NPDC058450]|uniref:hypothetical protein n=1 Tax=Lentzea sp. NPDC058450 TaxID=3346505 RepID=UPI00364AB54D